MLGVGELDLDVVKYSILLRSRCKLLDKARTPLKLNEIAWQNLSRPALVLRIFLHTGRLRARASLRHTSGSFPAR